MEVDRVRPNIPTFVEIQRNWMQGRMEDRSLYTMQLHIVCIIWLNVVQIKYLLTSMKQSVFDYILTELLFI